MKFSLYFLGYHALEDIPEDPADRVSKLPLICTWPGMSALCSGHEVVIWHMQAEWMFSQPATLELTHNWEHDVDFAGYHSGNQEPKGYGNLT
jgi:lactoylglutathione lyase